VRVGVIVLVEVIVFVSVRVLVVVRVAVLVIVFVGVAVALKLKNRLLLYENHAFTHKCSRTFFPMPTIKLETIHFPFSK
jgi:hypothetical protein